MSSEALAWAFKQSVKPSSVKLTLIALCECANYKTGKIFPSIEHLCEITGQNRKTIIANIAILEQQGLIADTGERAGTTRQIKVYQAHLGTVPKVERSQKRNSSKNGRKESQKRDTEPSREPSSNKHTVRARVIPDNWKPEPFGERSKCRQIVANWSPDELDTQIEHFVSHHRGKGSRFVDWQDAWKTWVLNSRRFGSRDRQSTGPPVDPLVAKILARESVANH